MDVTVIVGKKLIRSKIHPRLAERLVRSDLHEIFPCFKKIIADLCSNTFASIILYNVSQKGGKEIFLAVACAAQRIQFDTFSRVSRSA